MGLSSMWRRCTGSLIAGFSLQLRPAADAALVRENVLGSQQRGVDPACFRQQQLFGQAQQHVH